jgi:hypothetical protein
MVIVAIEGLLPCARCKDYFPPGQFHRNKALSTGRDCYCKACRNAYTREWLARQPPEYLQMRKRRQRSGKGPQEEARP